MHRKAHQHIVKTVKNKAFENIDTAKVRKADNRHSLRSTTEPGELKRSSRGYGIIISQHPRTVKLLFFI